MPDLVAEKQLAAEAAAELVADGDRIGLGTGSTVTFLLPALAARGLDIRCTATSPATEREARELGLDLASLDELGELEIAIDGADQIDPSGWLVKGGGGAHTREKIVAAAAARFVVIASSDKTVASLHAPVPLELLRFGLQATLRSLAPAELRDFPPTPEDNLVADYLGDVGDPAALATRLAETPGVVDHGLFSPQLVSEILVARGGSVERLVIEEPGAPTAST